MGDRLSIFRRIMHRCYPADCDVTDNSVPSEHGGSDSRHGISCHEDVVLLATSAYSDGMNLDIGHRSPSLVSCTISLGSLRQ